MGNEDWQKPGAAQVWPLVAAERRRLVEDLRTIDADAWDTPSLCAGWDVHDVLAHLIDSGRTTWPGFLRRMVMARFDFDRDNAIGVRRERRAVPTDTVEAFAAIIDRQTSPPAPLVTRLVEEFVHGEDIRRPLGISADYPPDAVGDALAHQVRTSVSFGGGRQRVDGLRLVATDTGMAYGAGAQVHGRAIDLLLVVSGRSVAPELLTGPGVGQLLAR